MTQMPIMPVLVERLLGDTNHLSNEEFGAYMRLLCNGWLRGAELHQEDLQRLAQAQPRSWPRLWKRLRPFFDEMSPKVYTQRGLDRELSRARKNHAANVLRNEKMRAGLARKNKRAAKNDEGSTDTVTRPVTKAEAAPKPSMTDIVTETTTTGSTRGSTALNPDKEVALPSKGRELLPWEPSLQTMDDLKPNGAAEVGSPSLEGGSPPQPDEPLVVTEALKQSRLVQSANPKSLYEALFPEEDDDAGEE